MAKLTVSQEMAFSEVFCRTGHNYDRDAVSRETGLLCEDESRTKQSFADECDINTIVRNFGLTGEIPSGLKMPQYGDFEGIFDYQGALNAVIAADEAFMQLPAAVRERFHHDPQKLLEFVANEANRDEAVRLGLIDKPLQTTEVPPAVKPAVGGSGEAGGGGSAP